MISLNRNYPLLRKRLAELQDELSRVQQQIAELHADEAFEEAWSVAGALLTQLKPAKTPLELHIEIEAGLAGWLQECLAQTGEDVETYINGLLLEDFLREKLS